MESNHSCFKCVLCDKNADYVIAGDSLCLEHKDRAQITMAMLKQMHNPPHVPNEETN